MKLKEEAVRYLTKAELEASREEEHRERLALQQRVARGELTAQQANQEAALIKEPLQWKLVNLKAHLETMARMFPVDYLPTARKKNGRRR